MDPWEEFGIFTYTCLWLIFVGFFMYIGKDTSFHLPSTHPTQTLAAPTFGSSNWIKDVTAACKFWNDRVGVGFNPWCWNFVFFWEPFGHPWGESIYIYIGKDLIKHDVKHVLFQKKTSFFVSERMIPTWISTSFTAEGWDCFAGKPHVTGLILRSVPIMIFLIFFGCANLFSKQDMKKWQGSNRSKYSLLWMNLLKTAVDPNKSCCSSIFFSHAVVHWFCVLDTGASGAVIWACVLLKDVYGLVAFCKYYGQVVSADWKIQAPIQTCQEVGDAHLKQANMQRKNTHKQANQ